MIESIKIPILLETEIKSTKTYRKTLKMKTFFDFIWIIFGSFNRIFVFRCFFHLKIFYKKNCMFATLIELFLEFFIYWFSGVFIVRQSSHATLFDTQIKWSLEFIFAYHSTAQNVTWLKRWKKQYFKYHIWLHNTKYKINIETWLWCDYSLRQKSKIWAILKLRKKSSD